ncbi:TonB-dependent receptor [Sphingomonas sp. MG17]|uniref:TonB-dependent receptor n=1 Tax=Sphingomonas tagetis TaxID=2949092 RepID=A0A9X2HK92_9SPHN|nr:TonB-dependent receptor [Sphingomonas tagetis]MCP3732443.1 TonB-dependent receptor [Sphingomonas tagetis]
MKLKAALFLSACSFVQPVLAQEAPTTAAPVAEESGEAILVTGSRIKQNPNDSALPLQVIGAAEIERNGISSPEQLIMYLSTNGSAADNLASNGDVTSGAQRGTNGLSAANLRGQGSAATLVLLNNRRVAAHGLQGGAVDVNQIPFAAIERVEVLKDGASAIYGTDAVGGVINFITKTDYQGVGAQGFVDIPEHGGGEIYRLSAIAGFGDLNEQGFNVMGAVSYSWNKILRGLDRDFVNTNQPNKGLSADTRGAPIATVFGLNGGAWFPTGTLFGNTTGAGQILSPRNGQRVEGANILDLPGGAGCSTVEGMMPYDEQIWSSATLDRSYGCAYDTGRAAVIQQPIDTLTYYGRAIARIAEDHRISLEITGSKASSAKSFSENQISSNATNLATLYPLNALTASTYNDVYDRLAAVFPGVGAVGDRIVDAVGNYGKPIAYRWRCIACGVREYQTDTDTIRVALNLEGPLFGRWDYNAGASYAKSESASVLGTGYHYRGTLGATSAIDTRVPIAPGATEPGLVGVLKAGLLNPFSLTQTAAGMAALDAVSAYGATLYGGRYEVKQLDYSISGPLFPLWGRDIQLAVGIDYRRETYTFNGSTAGDASSPVIYNAAFDNINALTPKNRDVKAAYAEMLIPLFKGFELTLAGRIDDYTGFGTTKNPKVSFKYRPVDMLMFRGSYNTSFRVPSFNQIFNGITISPYAGNDLVDPVLCPSGIVSTTNPSCFQIPANTVNFFTGGNIDLGPETAEQASFGVVFEPAPRFSASVDWWMINVENTIQDLSLRQLLDNAALFPERFLRVNNVLVAFDRRWINAGARETQGIEVSLRGGVDLANGVLSAGLDGTYLLKKREKLTPTAPWSASQIGIFTFTGDLGLRWKHNAFVSFANDDFALNVTQIFRKGYRNFQLPGIAAGLVRPDVERFVKDYVTYNFSVSYLGLGPAYKLTLGVRNVFDTDPPFAVTYDTNTGAGSSWEPRVGDPRGRSFTVSAEVKF